MKNKIDKLKLKKKKIIFLIFLLFIILIILFLYLNRIKKDELNFSLNYINSNEMYNNESSPEMIHMLIARYKGNVNPKTITKSTYYFIKKLIPEYYEKCKNEKSVIEYFNNNKLNISNYLGIDNFDEFSNIIFYIRKLNGNFKVEYSKFDSNSIINNSTNIRSNLIVKYVNNEEITFNLMIYNIARTNASSIKYFIIN